MKKWLEPIMYLQAGILMLVVCFGFFTGLVDHETKLTQVSGVVKEKFTEETVSNSLSHYRTETQYWVSFEEGGSAQLPSHLFESVREGEGISIVEMNAGKMLLKP